MFKKFIRIIFLVLVSIVLSSGVSLSAQWAKTYGGAGNDYGNIWPIGDGTYYLSGETDSFGAGKLDGLLAKLTASGGVSWAKTFGGIGNDALGAIDLADGGFFISGTSESFGIGNPGTPNGNVVFAKFDSTWKPVFQKVLGGARDESGYFTETNDTGFLFLGNSNSYGASADDDDLLLFKISSGGGLIWKKAYHYSQTDDVTGFVELSDGYLVAASVEDKLSTDQNTINDILLLKINKSTGAIIWKKLLTTTNGSFGGASFYKLNDGNYLLAGSLTTATGNTNIMLIKITPAGSVLLSKTYGSSAPGTSAAVANIINNTDGSLIVTGSVSALDMNTFSFTASVLVMKLNANLSIAWQKDLSNGMIFAGIYKIGSQVILSGQRSASMTAQSDAIYAKLNATTYEPVWAKSFGGTRNEWGWLTKINTNFMLSGNTETFGGALAGKANIFGIILDANGNYPSCNVKNFALTVGNPALTMSNLSVTTNANITIAQRTVGLPTGITLTKGSAALAPKDICTPIAAPQDNALQEPIESLELQGDTE